MAVLRGTQGSNTLYGTRARDTLYGDGGNDILIGGLGIDVLWGGAGADTFKFVDDYDSKHWQNSWDTIEDFSGEDRIDLSAIDANERVGGNQAFTWGTGRADGRVWIERQGGDTYVNAKIVGEGWVEVKLDDYSGPLTASDIIF